MGARAPPPQTRFLKRSMEIRMDSYCRTVLIVRAKVVIIIVIAIVIVIVIIIVVLILAP